MLKPACDHQPPSFVIFVLNAIVQVVHSYKVNFRNLVF